MEWFGRRGRVYVPITHSPDVDLIVELHGRLVRVQAKASSYEARGRWEISICTRGGNQSWNGLTSVFSAARCDLLFVLVADGRRWCIPADRVGGGQGLRLGGPKYAEYEVEPGIPFDVRTGLGPVALNASDATRSL